MQLLSVRLLSLTFSVEAEFNLSIHFVPHCLCSVVILLHWIRKKSINN